MSRTRVLLVDDDASIRRFVALALEDMDIELVACSSVSEALGVLRGGPVNLLITDLMMPGESGLDLLQMLQDAPDLRGDSRVAVFSAGLNAAMEVQLARFDIWRRLSKPISVSALEACVQDAMEAAGTATARSGQNAETAGFPADPVAAPLSPDETLAVTRHFAGDEALFRAFRDSCLGQFEADWMAGDSALRQGDAPRLQRLAHSLKSVLATLGHEALSTTARQLEDSAAAADWGTSRTLWARLGEGLLALTRHPPTTR